LVKEESIKIVILITLVCQYRMMVPMATIDNLDTTLWLVLIVSAFLTGMAKTGVFGLGTLVAPILASAFGGKISAGLLLPMLSMADIIAVIYYNRHASWTHLWKLFPFAALGVIIAIWVGEVINDNTFKIIMAVFILGSTPIMIIRERIKDIKPLKGNWWWGSFFGISGGFSTMIGNAAGPIMSLYLLAMQLPKNVLIGTGAWFFLVINLFKIPFHVFIWETITIQSFSLNLMMIPVVLAGGLLGIKVVKLIPEKPFRWLVIIMTILASGRLIFSIF
jgi:uncharacterized protein